MQVRVATASVFAFLTTIPSLLEYAGKHPCVVDHTGHALFFVDESTQALKGTGPRKRPQNSRVPRPKLKATQPAPQSSASGQSSDDDVPVQRRPDTNRQQLIAATEAEEHLLNQADSDSLGPDILAQSRQRLLAAARTSPSGHVKKRPRVGVSSRAPDSPHHSADDRPTRPLPHRLLSKDRKRKHVEVTTPGVHAPLRTHPAHTQVSQTRRGPPNLHNHAGTIPTDQTTSMPMYQPNFYPRQFSLQRPYPAHDGYVPHPYAYPPPYGPPAWGHPPQPPAHRQWPTRPSEYTTDDTDSYIPVGHRHYAP